MKKEKREKRKGKEHIKEAGRSGQKHNGKRAPEEGRRERTKERLVVVRATASAGALSTGFLRHVSVHLKEVVRVVLHDEHI